MNSAFRAIFLLVLASVGIDAQARPVAPCVAWLEARPTAADPSRIGPLRQPRCPIAIVYAAPALSGAGAPDQASKGGGTVAVEATLADQSEEPRDSIAPTRPMLHV